MRRLRAVQSAASTTKRGSATREVSLGLSLVRLDDICRRLDLGDESVRRIRAAISLGFAVSDSPVYIQQNARTRDALAETMISGETDEEAYRRIREATSAGAGELCDLCFGSYGDHPTEIDRGFAWVTCLCDGRRVKVS